MYFCCLDRSNRRDVSVWTTENNPKSLGFLAEFTVLFGEDPVIFVQSEILRFSVWNSFSVAQKPCNRICWRHRSYEHSLNTSNILLDDVLSLGDETVQIQVSQEQRPVVVSELRVIHRHDCAENAIDFRAI